MAWGPSHPDLGLSQLSQSVPLLEEIKEGILNMWGVNRLTLL